MARAYVDTQRTDIGHFIDSSTERAELLVVQAVAEDLRKACQPWLAAPHASQSSQSRANHGPDKAASSS